MKIIGNNNAMEILRLRPGETRPEFLSHHRLMLDQRADWTLRLLSSWGTAAALGDIMRLYVDDEQKKNLPAEPVPPEELVMRVCEVVDAAWNEMQHRGWIVKVESIDE